MVPFSLLLCSLFLLCVFIVIIVLFIDFVDRPAGRARSTAMCYAKSLFSMGNAVRLSEGWADWDANLAMQTGSRRPAGTCYGSVKFRCMLFALFVFV